MLVRWWLWRAGLDHNQVFLCRASRTGSCGLWSSGLCFPPRSPRPWAASSSTHSQSDSSFSTHLLEIRRSAQCCTDSTTCDYHGTLRYTTLNDCCARVAQYYSMVLPSHICKEHGTSLSGLLGYHKLLWTIIRAFFQLMHVFYDRTIFGWDTAIWKSGIWGCKKIWRKSLLKLSKLSP